MILLWNERTRIALLYLKWIHCVSKYHETEVEESGKRNRTADFAVFIRMSWHSS